MMKVQKSIMELDMKKLLLSLVTVFAICSLQADEWEKEREYDRQSANREQIRLEQERVVEDIEAKKREAWRLEQKRLEEKRVQDEVIRKKIEADRLERARQDARRYH